MGASGLKSTLSFNYQEYLASRDWALLREAVRERSGARCERGHDAPMQATHHLTYERIGRERLQDLQAVCNPCHEYLSGKRPDDPAEAGTRKAMNVLECLHRATDVAAKIEDHITEDGRLESARDFGTEALEDLAVYRRRVDEYILALHEWDSDELLEQKLLQAEAYLFLAAARLCMYESSQ